MNDDVRYFFLTLIQWNHSIDHGVNIQYIKDGGR